MTIDFTPWRRKATEDLRREHERAIAGELDEQSQVDPATTTTPPAASVPASPGMVNNHDDAGTAARLGPGGFHLPTYKALPPGTPTADVAEAYIRWEGTPRW